MSTFTILSFDPGGTTGWAVFRCTEMFNLQGKNEYYNKKFFCGQLGPQEHHKELEMLMGMHHTDKYKIVTESFEYRNNSPAGLELISREYIGVMKLFSQTRGISLTQQGAAEGKITPRSFTRKQNLERLGLWSPAYGHAMDAYGHLLKYMIKNNIIKEELLLTGWKK